MGRKKAKLFLIDYDLSVPWILHSFCNHSVKAIYTYRRKFQDIVLKKESKLQITFRYVQNLHIYANTYLCLYLLMYHFVGNYGYFWEGIQVCISREISIQHIMCNQYIINHRNRNKMAYFCLFHPFLSYYTTG